MVFVNIFLFLNKLGYIVGYFC